MVDTRRTPRHIETSTGLNPDTASGGGSNAPVTDPPPAPAISQGSGDTNLRPEVLPLPEVLPPPPMPVTVDGLHVILADVMGAMREEVMSQTQVILQTVTTMHANQCDNLSRQFIEQMRQLVERNNQIRTEFGTNCLTRPYLKQTPLSGEPITIPPPMWNTAPRMDQ
ncbi:hypothetical protein Dimus_039471 [Dionaea muscipula]